MKKITLALILLCSIAHVATNNAMKKKTSNEEHYELGYAPYNQDLNEYFDFLREIGHKSALYTLKGIRTIVCGSNYSLSKGDIDDDAPYGHPTIEDSVWKYATKRIQRIEAIEKKHEKTD